MAEQKSVAPPSLQVGGGGGAESKTQKPAAKKPAAATAAKPKPKPKPATKTAPLSSRSAGASALPKLQFAFPSEASFVCYGDHISLFCDDERQARGFLNADGVIDNSMRVIAEKSGALPNKFRDCIFRVMPSQQYGAAKEFKKKVLALTKAVDEGKIGEIEAGEEADKEEAAYFESLQESALKEEEMNMERNQTASSESCSKMRPGAMSSEEKRDPSIGRATGRESWKRRFWITPNCHRRSSKRCWP
jgi:hypothetical protein